MSLRSVGLDELEVRDVEAVRGIGVYEPLAQRLRDDDYRFLVAAPEDRTEDWARVLFLNLTYWNGEGDVLAEDAIAADVVAHVAWHHVIAHALHPDGEPTVAALAFGEAVASAFDVYLIGRNLQRGTDADLLHTAMPRLREVALDAGLDDDEVDALFQAIALDPDAAFENLRALLFDVTCALVACDDVHGAVRVLDEVRGHRFAPFLHHFEVSNWVLHMQARGRRDDDPAVTALDDALRAASVSLDVLTERCL